MKKNKTEGRKSRATLPSNVYYILIIADTLSGLQQAVLIKDEEEVTTTGSIEITTHHHHQPHSPTSQAVAGIAGDLSP
jgi:hypothetical protein